MSWRDSYDAANKAVDASPWILDRSEEVRYVVANRCQRRWLSVLAFDSSFIVRERVEYRLIDGRLIHNQRLSKVFGGL